MKIRTLNELQDKLDDEMAWRLKEIADLKKRVRESKGTSQKALIRASTALLYAHWEGFVKSTSIAYIEYLNGRRLTYDQLKSPLIAMGVKGYVNSISEAGPYEIRSQALDFIREKLSERFSVSASSAVDTKSNLSSTVFKNILVSLCVPSSDYEARFKFIDESLLARRNSIAHGEYLDVDAADWSRLSEEVLTLLRSFKTDLENSASRSTYLVAA